MAAKKTCECPKCGGTGYIEAFSGIAGGVCFRCNGSGRIAYRSTKKAIQPLTEYQAMEIEAIKTADMTSLGYERLLELRNFAHWPTPHCPELLAIWRERGEGSFQAAQEERLAEMGW